MEAIERDHRLMPRYPAGLPCELVVEGRRRRFLKDKVAQSFPARFVEVSVNGASIELPATADAPTYAEGHTIRVRIGSDADLSAFALVRHCSPVESGQLLGVEFVDASESFLNLIHDVVAAGRGREKNLMLHWERAR